MTHSPDFIRRRQIGGWNDRGSVLLMTLMFLVALSVVVAAFLGQVLILNRAADAQVGEVQALYLAEAGGHKAIRYLLADSAWRTAAYPAPAGNGSGDPREEALANGTYTMWAITSGASIEIISRGQCNSVSRTVRQDVTVPASGSLTAIAGSWKEL